MHHQRQTRYRFVFDSNCNAFKRIVDILKDKPYQEWNKWHLRRIK